MSDIVIPLLFWGGVLLCVGIFYSLHIQLRRKAYKKIALALNAKYEPRGLDRGGTISGQSSGKSFTIEDETFGCSAGHGYGVMTVISVHCQNKILPPLTVHGRFLNNFPNWKHAVYGVGIYPCLYNYMVPGSRIGEGHKPLVKSLFQETALFNHNFIRKGRFEIQPNKITFCKNNIITDIEIIKQVIQLLIKISRSIESADISMNMEIKMDKKENQADSSQIMKVSTQMGVIVKLTAFYVALMFIILTILMFRKAIK